MNFAMAQRAGDLAFRHMRGGGELAGLAKQSNRWNQPVQMSDGTLET